MSANTPARATILIVDDRVDNITLLSALLRGRYDTLSAGSGDAALQIAAGGQAVDLILLDVMMPGMDGYETCRRLKQDARTSAIPVVFLSARVMPGDEARGLAAGAVDYLCKPVDPDRLFERVAAHLRRGKSTAG